MHGAGEENRTKDKRPKDSIEGKGSVEKLEEETIKDNKSGRHHTSKCNHAWEDGGPTTTKMSPRHSTQRNTQHNCPEAAQGAGRPTKDLAREKHKLGTRPQPQTPTSLQCHQPPEKIPQ